MSLDERGRAELRMLRGRAYGPAADIASDPVALARLEELEAAARDSPAGTGAPAAPRAAPPSAAAARERAPEPQNVPGAANGAVPAPEPEVRPQAGRARRWVAALWPVSVVAAIVVGAVSYAAAVPLVSRDTEAAQVATLQPDPAFAWPEILGPRQEGVVAFREFYGLTAVYTEQDFWGNGEGCMIVLVTERIHTDSTSYDGPILYGCAAGSFPATVQLAVRDGLPPELRERFPVGTGLRFVFAGDRVGVFAATAE